MQLNISFVLVLAGLLIAGCGDDDGAVNASKPREGTITVKIDADADQLTSICYDVTIKNGANLIASELKRACMDAGTDFTWTTPCLAQSGLLTHSVTVNLVAAYLADGTAVADDPEGSGDLADIANPCPNGCTAQVACEATRDRSTTFSLVVAEKNTQGFIDLSLATTPTPETLPADLPAVLCYDVEVKNGDGDVVYAKAGLCDDDYGVPGSALSYVMPCDAKPGRANNTLKVSLSSVFLEARDATGVFATEPGVRNDYAFECAESCLTAVTCAPNADTAVDLKPSVRRIYPAGLVNVDVATTIPGDMAPPVAGGCYTISITNSQGQELVNQTAVCSAFHAATEGDPADLFYAAPCDSTQWPEGGTTHTAAIIVESLYDAEGTPTASGLPPATTIAGLTNPCPAEAPCTDTFVCSADVSATVDFSLEFEAAPTER